MAGTKEALQFSRERTSVELNVDGAIEKAKKKGLRPGRVKGTDGIQFTRGRNKGIEVISWDEFRETLKKPRLQVYESSSYLKIMKKRRRA